MDFNFIFSRFVRVIAKRIWSYIFVLIYAIEKLNIIIMSIIIIIIIIIVIVILIIINIVIIIIIV